MNAACTLTLDDVLPAPHFRERHARHVGAPPQAVWDALMKLRLGDLALSRALMAVRLLPIRLAGRSGRRVSGSFLEKGPLPVLASCAPRWVLAGAAIQPWRLTSGYRYPSGLYWAAIRAGSGLIRRDMLRAVARSAEG